MQVTQTREVKTNIQNAVQFTISDDASKLFSMLSSALYTDKEKAVVYELGANCYDANPTEPFLIVAPTTLEPQIKFRDYGPGLAEHDVYRLLTVYGASDKSNSNTQIGGYGIGAKSPAAVTDTWTVTSYHKGKGMEFMVYINENGIPSLTKIREYQSDETGLEVSIPVATNRFNAWQEALKIAFRYYPVKPIIKNCHVAYKDVEYITAGSNWKLNKSGFENYNTNATLITTHRAYSPDVSKLEVEFKDDVMLQKLLRFPLVIDFNIGELQLSLSRESVQYTKSTVAVIRRKLETVKTELVDQINAILNTAKDGFDFRQKIYDVEKQVLGRNSINASSSSAFLLKVINNRYNISNLNNDIKQVKIKVADEKDLAKILQSLKMKVYNGTRFQQVNAKTTCFKSYAIVLKSQWDNGKSFDEFYLRLSIPMMEKIMIVVADDKRASAKVKHYFDDKKHRFILQVNKNIFPKEMQTYVVKASKLASPPRAARGTKQPRSAAVLKTDIFGFRTNSLTKIPAPEATKVAFVTFENAKDTGSIKERWWGLLRDYLQDAGWSVVGLRVGKPVPKGYVNVVDAARELMNQYHSQAYWDNEAIGDQLYTIKNGYRNDITQTFHKMATFRTPKKSVWNELQDEYSKMVLQHKLHTNIMHYEKYNELCKYFNVIPCKKESGKFIDKIKTTLYDTYGMLKFVSGYFYDENRQAIEEYLTIVGK